MDHQLLKCYKMYNLVNSQELQKCESIGALRLSSLEEKAEKAIHNTTPEGQDLIRANLERARKQLEEYKDSLNTALHDCQVWVKRSTLVSIILIQLHPM